MPPARSSARGGRRGWGWGGRGRGAAAAAVGTWRKRVVDSETIVLDKSEYPARGAISLQAPFLQAQAFLQAEMDKKS
jgi:hypothetical protein